MKKIALFVVMAFAGFLTSVVLGVFLNRPPAEVPENLNARQYYDLGIKYKLAGWIAQSKKSLQLAIKQDPDGVGKEADTYLKAYLPINDIPEEAVHANIAAVNESILDKAKAEKAYLEVIKKYPDFEWPYGNLGKQYADQGRIPEAKELLNKALKLNPHYASGIIHMAAVMMKENNQAEADKLLKEYLKIDPKHKSNVLGNYPDLEKRIETLTSKE